MRLYLSLSKLSGNFEPGGNSGRSSGFEDSRAVLVAALEEFPALPDLTMPFLGGMCAELS